MSISEFNSRINLIMSFTSKMNRELVPVGIQKVILKVYAATLKINLTDNMVNDIIFRPLLN